MAEAIRPKSIDPYCHFFASKGGYVLSAMYQFNQYAVAGAWSVRYTQGATELPYDERLDAQNQAIAFAQEEWPGAGGTLSLGGTEVRS